MPEELYDFVLWFTSDEHYRNVTNSKYEQDPVLRVITICHHTMGITRNQCLPITLGLALQKKLVGSKKLIEVLHNLGYCVSYDEVRRFLTSVVNSQISQAKEGVYIPRGLQRVNMEDANTMIDAAIDNFEQNEDTLDGKTTMHSMAAVLYQRCEVVSDDERLPRCPQKVLDLSEYTEEPLRRYQKPI